MPRIDNVISKILFQNKFDFIMNGFNFPSNEPLQDNQTFFCSMLKGLIGNAFKPGHVIEIVGEAGSGKTQMAIHLSARSVIDTPRAELGIEANTKDNATNDYNDTKALYISTEGSFPIGRLRQMIEAMGQPNALMDKIFIKSITSIEDLMDCLEKKVYQLAKQIKLGILVIDSVAAPIRAEFETKESRDRTIAIHRLGSVLNTIGRKLSIPVVVLNQVTAVIDNANQSFGRNVVPCFGLGFSNYVHTRIFLTRTDLVIKDSALSNKPDNSDDIVQTIHKDTRLRTATIDFSPHLPSGKPIHFIIDSTGPRGVNVR